MRRRAGFAGGVALVVALLAPGAAAGAVQRIEEFRYATKAHAVAAGTVQRVVTRCPRRSHVLSGGVQLSTLSSDVRLGGFAPFDGGDRNHRPDDGWQAVVEGGLAPDTVSVIAICTRLVRPTYARERLVTMPNSEPTVAKPKCPRTRRYEAGYSKIAGGISFPVLPATVPSMSGWRPAYSAWHTTIHHAGPPVAIVAYTVCVRESARVYFSRTGRRGTLRPGERDLPMICLSGRPVVGGAVRLTPDAAFQIRQTGPVDGRDPDSVPGDRWISTVKNTRQRDGRFYVEAICDNR